MTVQLYRISMLVLILVVLSITSISANDITVHNFRQKCRIGPIRVTDRFGMNTLNQLFGPISREVMPKRLV